jgi:hemoglobin
VSAAPARSDIADREDVSPLAAELYRRVFTDELLGPVFIDVARVDLAVHLPVMCDFWATVLLRAGLYHRKALRPHVDLTAKVQLAPAHFTRWLALWTATVEAAHRETAELAKVQAARIGGAISRRLRGRSAAEDAIIQTEPPDPRLP